MRSFPILLVLALAGAGVRAQESPMPPLPPTVADGATIERIYTGDERLMLEGPVWDPVSGALLFTACRADQILRLDASGEVTVWMEPTGGINGMIRSRSGRLIGAAVTAHQIVSIGIGPGGPTDVAVLAGDPAWNQPNDVCEAPDGTLYFSDPSWASPERSAVYQLIPGGQPSAVLTGLETPNGVITTADGARLIVGDSRRALWMWYTLHQGEVIPEGRKFFNPDTPNRDDPDGMTRDADGNLYLSGRGGVWVVTPEGEALGLIPAPAFVSNVCFGGDDGQTLFMTGRGAVWRLAMRVRGAPVRPEL